MESENECEDRSEMVVPATEPGLRKEALRGPVRLPMGRRREVLRKGNADAGIVIFADPLPFAPVGAVPFASTPFTME